MNIIAQNYNSSSNVDIDRSCLRSLQCPDSHIIKGHLKINKDNVIEGCIDWIFRTPQYSSWKDGNNVCLFWIKGVAGRGKTMLSIGLVERLQKDKSNVVTYFFCQNGNCELNSLEAIIKGLILQLVLQQEQAMETLRSHWDEKKNCFDEDMTSWRTLWDVFLRMLHRCKCPRVYVVVDGLDGCQDDGMVDFLKSLVRMGLDEPSKIKWLLTSRPLNTAERELSVTSDQILVSLELNQGHISEAVLTYINHKVEELKWRLSYGPTLSRKIKTELTEKAEYTYLWVALVCKKLESVHPNEALSTIQDLPQDLHDLYHEEMKHLTKGKPRVVKACLRLLKVMMLAYRPLNIEEVVSVTGQSCRSITVESMVHRCGSLAEVRGKDVVIASHSAREYLAGKNGQSILDSHEHYGHGEVALKCLFFLSQRLKVNLVDLPRPDSTRELMKRNELVESVDYAATFWVQHLRDTKPMTLIQNALAEQGEVGTFMRTKLLMWLEGLSLLGRLPHALEALKILKISAGAADVSNIHSILKIIV